MSKQDIGSLVPIRVAMTECGAPVSAMPRASELNLKQTHLSDKPGPHPFQSLTISREGESRLAEGGETCQGGRGSGPTPPSSSVLLGCHPTEPQTVGRKLNEERVFPVPPCSQWQSPGSFPVPVSDGIQTARRSWQEGSAHSPGSAAARSCMSQGSLHSHQPGTRPSGTLPHPGPGTGRTC